MAVEVYVPEETRFTGDPMRGVRMLVLYGRDGEARSGSVTTTQPLQQGARGGPLVVLGRRDGRAWKVTFPEIVVRNNSAMGFEFDVLGPAVVEPAGPAA